MAPPT